MQDFLIRRADCRECAAEICLAIIDEKIRTQSHAPLHRLHCSCVIIHRMLQEYGMTVNLKNMGVLRELFQGGCNCPFPITPSEI